MATGLHALAEPHARHRVSASTHTPCLTIRHNTWFAGVADVERLDRDELLVQLVCLMVEKTEQRSLHNAFLSALGNDIDAFDHYLSLDSKSTFLSVCASAGEPFGIRSEQLGAAFDVLREAPYETPRSIRGDVQVRRAHISDQCLPPFLSLGPFAPLASWLTPSLRTDGARGRLP